MKREEIENRLKALYFEKYGVEPGIRPVTGGGSTRRYYRMNSEGRDSLIGVWGEDVMENLAFINLAKSFRKAGLNVPSIIDVSVDGYFYFEEDLGDLSLYDALHTGDRLNLGRAALREIVKLQSIKEDEWEESVIFPPFGERLVRWDLNYFKYDFLKPCGVIFNEEKLEDDFDMMVGVLTSIPGKLQGFMYRDFQSRNIMMKDEKLWLIDFQGGRRGPLVYDAVSFIWQAKAPFTVEERETLGKYYAELTAASKGINVDDVEKEILPILLFRTLQVLGAYGFRGLIERKPHFISSIPGAQQNLKYLLAKGAFEKYPELHKISTAIINKKFRDEEPPEGLTVRIYSFSYKKGYPEDKSGNGGGFMFDCRGIHNPGRYEEFKALTGRDEPVKKFLLADGEAERFIDDAFKVVSPSIERYLERGFSSLQVGFGCTGGQHRSVYCAEGFAGKVAQKFPGVKIELIHREQI